MSVLLRAPAAPVTGAGRADAGVGVTVAGRADASVRVTVAGRTDAGVHAWGQVCSYAGEPAPVTGLNALLPADVAALSCEPAADGFDARRDATSRAYCYRVLARRTRSALEAGRALHWPHRVDLSALEACASALVGEHDFTAFTPTETEHVRFSRRVLAAFWRRAPAGERASVGRRAPAGDPDVLEFWIEADAFMRHMNRVLVGTMLEVAGGRRPLSGGPRPLAGCGRALCSFAELLDGRPRSDAGSTAPAHGLYLAGVGYGGERVLAVD